MIDIKLTSYECLNKNVSAIKQIKNIRRALEDKSIRDAFEKFEYKYMPIYWRIFYFANKNRLYFISYCMGKAINKLRTMV